MSISFRRASAVVPVLLCLAVATSASARPDRPKVTRASGAARPIGPASSDARATTILGSAWTADNAPIGHARLRLRNVITGRIEAVTVADDLGQFTFPSAEPGSYLVELVNETDRVQVAGHVFTIAQGETVATFVRLTTKVPWFTTFFTNSVAAISSTAASEGITALAPVARPVSAKQ